MSTMEPSFDFERGLDPNVGQPVRPPPEMPAAGRKNYRMVRACVRASECDVSCCAALKPNVEHTRTDASAFCDDFCPDRMPPLAAWPLHERKLLWLSASV